MKLLHKAKGRVGEIVVRNYYQERGRTIAVAGRSPCWPMFSTGDFGSGAGVLIYHVEGIAGAGLERGLFDQLTAESLGNASESAAPETPRSRMSLGGQGVMPPGSNPDLIKELSHE